ncbi:MAG: hypothetical protein Q4B50_07385 [Bacillota bacterium]|nr:hypothetical protein [Bacillota bacterium]
MKAISIFLAAAAEKGEHTALEKASTASMDLLAQKSELGLLRVVPPGQPQNGRKEFLAALGAVDLSEKGDLRKLYGFNAALLFFGKGPEAEGRQLSLSLFPLELRKEEKPYEALLPATHRIFAAGYNFLCLYLDAGIGCKQDEKIQRLTEIDRKLIGPLLAALAVEEEEYSLLLTAGAFSPCAEGEDSHPLPFLIYRSQRDGNPAGSAFSEKAAAASGLLLPESPMLMQRFSGKYHCELLFDTVSGI